MSELKQKAVTSAKWTMLSSIISAISGPIYKILLGIILLTKDFAYLSVITLVNTLANLIGDIGIGKSLIKKKNVDNEEFTAALVIKICISLVIGIIIFSLSNKIEKFYGYEGLNVLLKLTIITILLSSINNVYSNILQKELLFKEYSIAGMLRNIIDMFSSIIYILLGFGVKGYVYGTITATIITTIYTIYVVKRKSNFKLVKKMKINDPKDFWGFGITISIKEILTYIIGKLDEIIIGRVFGAEILGIYFFGKDFVKKPQEIVSSAMTQSLFPILVQIKEDKEKLKSWYLKITKYISIVSFPLFVGLAVTSNYYITILYKGKWDNSVLVIKLFCIVALITILTANVSTSTLYSLDKHNKVLIIDIITNIGYISALLLNRVKSLYVIVAIYMIYTFVKCIWLQNQVGKNLEYRWKKYIYQINKSGVASFIMLVVILIVNKFLVGYSPIIILLGDVIIGICIYSICIFKLDPDSMKELIKMCTKRKVEVV